MTDREHWQEIANQMARDNKRREQKDKELMDYIRAHPGGRYDSLVEGEK